MHDLLGVDNFAAKGLTNGLLSETNAEDGKGVWRLGGFKASFALISSLRMTWVCAPISCA